MKNTQQHAEAGQATYEYNKLNQDTTMQCITISYGKVKGKAKEYRYIQPALYEAKHRKDGVLTWRYLHHLGIARRSDKLAEKDAQEFANEYKIPLLKGIRHNMVVIN